jgi:predicted porin
MKKTIIAAAVAAVVAAPAAFAEVSVSGLVHMSVTDSDTGTGTGRDVQGVNDNVSRLVFSGSEDLGNGMKAGFKMEQRINMATADLKDDGRESYGYIGGDFGTVKFGRLYGAAKKVYSIAEQAGDTAIDITTLSDTGSSSANAEVTNDGVLAYVSPNFNGVTLEVQVSNHDHNNTAVANQGLAEETNVSLVYSANGLTIGAASYSDDNSTTADQTAFGVKYAMGDFTVAASQMESDATSTNTKKSTAVSGSMKMGNNTLIVQYGEKETGAGVTTDGWGAALVHSMSKSTAVYAGLRDSDVASDNSTAVALGFKHSF